MKRSIKKFAFITMVTALIITQFHSSYSISNHDAIKGCLFGGAMGDAMGCPTEFIKSVQEIYERYPQGIRSFQDFKTEDLVAIPSNIRVSDARTVQRTKCIARYTDDTAMSVITMKALLKSRDNKWDLDTTMNHLATEYVWDMKNNPNGWAAEYRAPGNTCLANTRKLASLLQKKGKLEKKDWMIGGSDQGGCGSVMRAHPFGLVLADDPHKAALWAAEHSKITHGAPMAQAACAAMALGTAYALSHKGYDYICDAMIQEARKYDEDTAVLMEKAFSYATTNKHTIANLKSNEPWLELLRLSAPAYKEFLGWDARTAIAATLYTFALTCGSDVKKAIFLGVHTPGDSDSIASMSGALVGAMDGFIQLEKGWEKDLEMLEGNKKLTLLADMTLRKPRVSKELPHE